MEQTQNLKAFILGGTGAVGRELIHELLQSDEWIEVTVVARRILPEWDKFTPEQKKKLNVKLVTDLECLLDPSNWDLTGYSSVFCCLGTRKRYGEKEFIKVAKTYPLYGARLALYYKIPHFSVISSELANPKSLGLIFKTKGEVEEELKKLQLLHLSIFRPGILVNRRNYKRFKERILGGLFFVPQNETEDVAKALRIEAELQNKTPLKEMVVIYRYYDINYIAHNIEYPFH